MPLTSHFDLKGFKLGCELTFLSLFAVEVESNLLKLLGLIFALFLFDYFGFTTLNQ